MGRAFSFFVLLLKESARLLFDTLDLADFMELVYYIDHNFGWCSSIYFYIFKFCTDFLHVVSILFGA
jgi:hypothetical protein